MLDIYEFVEDVEIELTTLCNAKCPLCYRNYNAFKEHYPKNIIRPLVDVIAQLDKFVNLKVIRLVGSISEPTLYKDFFKLIEYLNNRDIAIEICTNGDTNNELWWEKLGKLLKDKDRVYFTICGSTQELHETYRANTNLSNILKNASALRRSRKIDYAQCIRFNYNDNDFNSDEFRNTIKDFSHIYMTETFLQKNISIYRKSFNQDLFKPFNAKLKKYTKAEKLAKNLLKIPHKCECTAFKNNSCQIDIYGNVYPCYLFLEASKGEKWDLNWNSILNGKYDVCMYCEKNVKKFCKENDLDYIF